MWFVYNLVLIVSRTHMSLNDKKRLAREKAEQYNSNGRPSRQYHMLTAEEVKQGKETRWEQLEIIGILYCFYVFN